MSFSINTNIASLQAQNYLRMNANFQTQTINEVTSGYRIVNAGDDAAGLAVANGLASDEAVLTQGIQNANDGLATLQTIDGGMSNISQLLNRASTLATESASGTFTGDRSQLNSEFQSVLTEINRQAQSIGMNTGGEFAKSLSIFIGGGKDAVGNETDQAAITNGSVSINLSQSAVDQQGLGLQSYQTTPSATTSLNTITAGTDSGEVDFTFTGPGFASGVTVAAQGIDDASSLSDVVNDINTAITQTASSAGAANQAFASAGIQAQLNAAGTGIVFSSANGGFAVAANTDGNGAAAAENILGTNAEGKQIYAQGTQQLAIGYGTDLAQAETQNLTISAVDSSGDLHSVVVTLDNAGGAETQADVVNAINAQLQTDVGGPLANLVAVNNTTADNSGITLMGNNVQFSVFAGASSGGAGDGATVTVGGNQVQSQNLNSAQVGTGGALDISTAGGAETAINALANAVTSLGTAQANVGKGENNFNYAINLANSQLTNETAAESNIRDANMATEAANLTKAQILMQAGVAALAQANSAPQQILSLLKQQ